MAELEIKWLHSHGWDNKDPLYDLGGMPSRFDIATQPVNNLFDDITPEEAKAGRTDYRCIYVINKTLDTTYTSVQVQLNSGGGCSSIAIGSKLVNDLQTLILQGTPMSLGYVILETEFGGPFTCYWNGDYTSFASEIQTKIRLTTLCDGVMVSSLGGGEYQIEFAGSAMNRKVELIKVVKNRLVYQQGDEFRVSTAQPSDPFNHQGNTEIQVTNTISGIPSVGVIHIYNPDTGLYEDVDYSSYSGMIFTLSNPLPFDLVFIPSSTGTPSQTIPYGYDSIWVELPEIDACPVLIKKKTDGWPIRQYANIIDSEIVTPDWMEGSPINIGTLMPLDGFFLWIQRITTAATNGCTGTFQLILTGDY
jgi:hypothetical protein